MFPDIDTAIIGLSYSNLDDSEEEKQDYEKIMTAATTIFHAAHASCQKVRNSIDHLPSHLQRLASAIEGLFTKKKE